MNLQVRIPVGIREISGTWNGLGARGLPSTGLGFVWDRREEGGYTQIGRFGRGLT